MSQDQMLNHNTQHNLWVRCLLMLLMALAYQVTGTLILIVTIVQFLMMLMNDATNARLILFGRSLGRYLQQITHYLTFVSEEMPFPFNDWPASV